MGWGAAGFWGDAMTFDRCRRCLGMGYKGRKARGKWKIRTCERCGGTGQDPRPETLPENKIQKTEESENADK